MQFCPLKKGTDHLYFVKWNHLLLSHILYHTPINSFSPCVCTGWCRSQFYRILGWRPVSAQEGTQTMNISAHQTTLKLLVINKNSKQIWIYLLFLSVHSYSRTIYFFNFFFPQMSGLESEWRRCCTNAFLLGGCFWWWCWICTHKWLMYGYAKIS